MAFRMTAMTVVATVQAVGGLVMTAPKAQQLMEMPLAEVFAADHVEFVGGDHPTKMHKVKKATLRLAAQLGDTVLLEHLIGEGDDMAGVDAKGRSALHWAAWHGHEAAVAVLLRNGAHVDTQTAKDKVTPLMAAAVGCRANVAAILLNAGAYTRLLDVDGYSALQQADMVGCDPVSQVIRQHIRWRRWQKQGTLLLMIVTLVVAVLIHLYCFPAEAGFRNASKKAAAASVSGWAEVTGDEVNTDIRGPATTKSKEDGQHTPADGASSELEVSEPRRVSRVVQPTLSDGHSEKSCRAAPSQNSEDAANRAVK